MESSSYENWEEIEMPFGNLVIGNLQFAISNWQHVIGYWYLALSNYELAAVNRKKAIWNRQWYLIGQTKVWVWRVLTDWSVIITKCLKGLFTNYVISKLTYVVLQIMTPTWCYIPSGVLNNDEWWTKFTFFDLGPNMCVKIITSSCFSKWNHKEIIIPNKILKINVFWIHITFSIVQV